MPDRVLAPGASVWIRNRLWRVERVRRTRAVVTLDVRSRGERRTYLTPFDRPRAAMARRRPTRVRAQQALARLASLVAHASSARSLNAAVDARVDLWPYQLEPALAIIAGGARRVLIADDVGLGKTIQAAHAIAELATREPDARILVLTPASLAAQWRAELAERFRLDAEAIDRAALDLDTTRVAAGDSPWRAAGIRIVSPDFLKQPHVFDALPALSWDAVVIDEAHVVCGDSERHARCATLAAHARRVILLTATPHDGDALKFARLVALGSVAGAPGPLVVFRRTRADVGIPANRRVRWHRVSLTRDEELVLDALGRLGRAGRSRTGGLDLLLTVFRKRAMSTMRALVATIDRRLAWLGAFDGEAADPWQQSSLPFGDEDDIDLDERRALTSDTGLEPRREREWLTRTRSLAVAAARRESKVARLASLIARTREAAIVFTEYRDSLHAVQQRLARITALATLHGGQSPAERNAELRRFLTGEARVLVATDVAGIGLNLHTRCRWVITLDLPWNPARLDQRIGRVDRIGQTRVAHHTILVARHAHDAHVLTHLRRRGDAAAAAIGPAPAGAVDDDARLPASSARYRRAAIWIARTIARRRRFADRWRHEPPARSAFCVTRPERSGCGRVVHLIFAVPIVDGADREIDVEFVACRSVAVDHDTRATIVERASAAAARCGAARAARLARWLEATAAAGDGRDAAIAAALVEPAGAPIDVGLFD